MRSTTARSRLAGRRHALSAPRPHRHNGSAMETQRVTVALIDRSGGYEASPERVRLAALADFAADVETFLRGAGKEIDPAEIDVAVRAGSLAIETQPLPPDSGVLVHSCASGKTLPRQRIDADLHRRQQAQCGVHQGRHLPELIAPDCLFCTSFRLMMALEDAQLTVMKKRVDSQALRNLSWASFTRGSRRLRLTPNESAAERPIEQFWSKHP